MEEKYILICQDSLEGIFTGVYNGWSLGAKGIQVELCMGQPEQPELFSRYMIVDVDQSKAEKVARTIRRELGFHTYESLCYAACSTDGEKGTCIYQAIREGLSKGKGNPRILENLKSPYILKVMRMRQTVWHEMHRFLGFVRFQEIQKKILFSVIQPDNAVLPLIAPHFADRLPRENWIIYDEGRQDALIHPAEKNWYIWRQAAPFMEQVMEKENAEEYVSLWKEFCQSISVVERRNAKLQQQNLPNKYRKHLTEFC